MKKVLLMAFALFLIMSCIGLSACGSSGETSEKTTSATKTTGQTAPTTTESSGGGETTWLEVPIYPGAKLLVEQGFPGPNEKFSKEIHRYYETGDSSSKVSAFYQSGMPPNGWEEIAWVQGQVLTSAEYQKNDQKDLANVGIVPGDNDKTVIHITRVY